VVSKFAVSWREPRLPLAYLVLASGLVAGLVILSWVMPPAQAQTAEGDDGGACPPANVENSVQVPGAEREDEYRLPDLTTKGLTEPCFTNKSDWENGILSLHAAGTVNPPEPVPGIQVNGCFPDDSTTNDNRSCDHDSQFVMRFPDDWNGKLVIAGPPGNRRQYANDFVISDYVLSRGYAYASTDKGNSGNKFYEDGERPGDAVAEWHRRVEQLTKATKEAVESRYDGKTPEYTYITGISNAGYLTRYALENTPELYDGGVDWEGTLFRRNGPNLFTFLPPALRHYQECQATGFDEDARPCRRMYEAGYEKGSEFLWPLHYSIYWDLTQRIYREEFDPRYDGRRGENGTEPGTPFCQDETDVRGCDANYRYKKRPERVKEAVERVSLTGRIGKPMITLHGTYDALLPIDADSNPYSRLVENARKGNLHRYYKIEKGNHVDRFYNYFPTNGEGKERLPENLGDLPELDGIPLPEESSPESDSAKQSELRPILPCHRAAFEELEEWVEKDNPPPSSRLVEKSESDDPRTGDEVNYCSINEEATYSGPTDTGS
jgi:hypothetical protein